MGEVFSIPLRVGFTLVLLAVPFLAGMSLVSPWWILPMAFVFVLADVMGKWRLLFQGGPLSEPLMFAFKALAVQPFVVGVIYLIGRGVGSFSGVPDMSPFGGGMTAGHIGIYALVMFLLGLALIWAERGKRRLEDVVADVFEAQRNDGLDAPAAPVTVENFFDGHHYANCEYDDNEQRIVLPSAHVSEAEITAREAELGVTLPATLRALYLLQNGGSVQSVYAGDWQAPNEEDADPFTGYESLSPLGLLRDLHDHITDYAYEEQLEMFPKGAKQMLVIAQWYRVTLFLDYRAGEVPRVGLYDFDEADDLQDDSWQEDATFWPDFEAFFGQLYRQDRY